MCAYGSSCMQIILYACFYSMDHKTDDRSKNQTFPVMVATVILVNIKQVVLKCDTVSYVVRNKERQVPEWGGGWGVERGR